MYCSKTALHIPTPAEINNAQWRYVGYSGFSKFISSDNDFFIFRKFGALSARTLLILQDQLAVLEDKLEKLDQKCMQHDDIHNGSFRRDDEGEGDDTSLEWQRSQLNAKIISKLKEYSKSCIF
jgi:hypothetical protein